MTSPRRSTGDAGEFFRQDLERRFGPGHPARTDWIINEIPWTPVETIASLHRWVVTVDLRDELRQITSLTLIVTGEHADRPERRRTAGAGDPQTAAYTSSRATHTTSATPTRAWWPGSSGSFSMR